MFHRNLLRTYNGKDNADDKRVEKRSEKRVVAKVNNEISHLTSGGSHFDWNVKRSIESTENKLPIASTHAVGIREAVIDLTKSDASEEVGLGDAKEIEDGEVEDDPYFRRSTE